MGKSPLRCVAIDSVFWMISFACKYRFLPYDWNSKSKQLSKCSRTGNWIFHFRFAINHTMTTIIFVRLIQFIKENVPARIRLHHYMLCIAFGLYSVCKYQFHVKRREIMNFTNVWLKRITLKQEELLKGGSKLPRGVDWYSICMLFTLYLLIVNPLPHALLELDTPCAPEMLASIFLTCSAPSDRSNALWKVIPFVVTDIWIFTEVTLYAVAWILLYNSIFWLKEEIEEKLDSEKTTTQMEIFGVMHRKIQVISCTLNDAFGIYLVNFPSLLFVLAGVFIFAAIRFTYLPFHIYAVFPACAARCIFEATTLLQLAGRMSLKSEKLLRKLERTPIGSPGFKIGPSFLEYRKRFMKSSKKLGCSAGSFYTYESTILLVCINNCIQLLFDLLVGYPKERLIAEYQI